MKTVEVLKAARELLTKGWTKGSAAKDANGNRVGALSPAACSWCAMGALIRATNGKEKPKAEKALREAVRDCGFAYIAAFNDKQTSVEPVLDLFDKAIARLEAGQ